MACFPEAGLDLSALPDANRGADPDMIRCRRAGLREVRLLAPANPSDGALADLRRRV